MPASPDRLSSGGGGCGGLTAEALVAGKPVRLEKHEAVFEFYGAVEEAELHLAKARLRLEERGLDELATLAGRLQEYTRLLPHLLALGAVDEDIVEGLRGILGSLPRPGGWLLAGCGGEEEVELGLASTLLRRADRLLSRMAAEGLAPARLAEQLSSVASMISDALYRMRWLLCSGRAWSPGARAAATVTHV